MSRIEIMKKSKEVYAGRIIRVKIDDIVVAPDIKSTREIVEHNGGVCALIRTPENKIKFVKQYRYALKKEILELPAGKIEKGENPDQTIRREVEEEVGIIPKSIESLGYIYSSPGFCTEIIYLYYIDEYEESETSFDFDEYLEEYEITYEEAIEKVKSNIINDAKTIALLFKAKDKFK